MLLFSIGLEFSLGELWCFGRNILIGGGTRMLLVVLLLTTTAADIEAAQYFTLSLVSLCFIVCVDLLQKVLALWLIPRFACYRSPELIVRFSLCVLGGVTFAAWSIGLPPAIGAFAAGLIFSGNRWSHQIDSLILPFRETFSAVFFVSLCPLS